MKHILAIDQGTTSSRAILFDQQGRSVAVVQQEFNQYYPHPGWVEHDADEIWQSQLTVCQQLIAQSQLRPADIAAIGITNQRETTVVWERSSGRPIYRAIVWQDLRTTKSCERLKAEGLEAMVTAKTGLLLEAYFSATKIGWILDHVEGARSRAEQGELAFGTIDSWLLWNLTAGALHLTDVTNAARTLLFNIDRLQWDDELLALFEIPAAMLPAVKSSSEYYGTTVASSGLAAGIPISAMIGDQQAALFGQHCFEPGMVKCTYGTGAFLNMNSGTERVTSNSRLLTTIGWQIGDQLIYTLEGSLFTAGALIQWLRDGLQLFDDVSESEALASSVDDNGGVVFIPALSGLGAPHWDPGARGTIFGISRGTTKAHIIRAALEGICFQVNDLLSTMAADSGKPITELRIDGGAAANNLLCQLQADIASIRVIRPTNLESTALGAAYLAGIATQFWSLDTIAELWQQERQFDAAMDPATAERLIQQWSRALQRAKGWVE